MTIENETNEILEQGDIAQDHQELVAELPYEEKPGEAEEEAEEEAKVEPPKEEPKPEKKKLSHEERQAQINKAIKEKWEAHRALESEREQLKKEREEILALKSQYGVQEDAPPDPSKYTEDQFPQYMQDLAQHEAKKIVKEQMTNNDKLAKEKAEFESKEKIKMAYNHQYAEKVKGDPTFADREMNVAKYLQLTNRDDLVTLIMSEDDRADIIDYLGGNLEKLEQIAELPPMRVAKELGKITARLSEPKSRTVSKANAPINPLKQTGGNAVKALDQLDYEAYKQRRFKEMYG